MIDVDSHLNLAEGPLDRFLSVPERCERGGWEQLVDECASQDGGVPDDADVWAMKGSGAPGSANPTTRAEVLRRMGITRQLVLPRVRVAVNAWQRPGGASISKGYNRFAARWGAQHRDVLSTAGILVPQSPESSAAEVARCAEEGVRALLLPSSAPIGGVSPGSTRWDPLWRAFADCGVTAVLHAGSDKGFLDPNWSPETRWEAQGGAETSDVRLLVDVETVGPFDLATMHMSPQVFLTSLYLDGVLDRFSGLRLGAIEFGAAWVGPWLESLEKTVDVFGAPNSARRPTEAFVAQLRVTPFHWEPVGTFLNRHGHPELYCFSSDFPHREGGNAPVDAFNRALRAHDESVVKGFFSENASLILG